MKTFSISKLAASLFGIKAAVLPQHEATPKVRSPKSPSQALLRRLKSQNRTYAQWAHMMATPDPRAKYEHNANWTPRNTRKAEGNKLQRAARAAVTLRGAQ